VHKARALTKGSLNFAASIARHFMKRSAFSENVKEQDHLATLSRWAGWGRASAPARTPLPDWSAVDALVGAAKPQLLENAKCLRELLQRSSTQLMLSDPLLCDLGVNRWLSGETAYSDWLAWALEQLGDAQLILDVLGVRSAAFASTCAGTKPHVRREAPVQEGLPGNDGLIDLLISFGDPPRALLGVEVKTYDQQYWKQQGYIDSLRGIHCDVAPECVLVAIEDASERQRCGFRLRSWKEVGLGLRRATARYAKDCEHVAIAAMTLAFVAAIERNLLGIGTTAARRAWRANQPSCRKCQSIWFPIWKGQWSHHDNDKRQDRIAKGFVLTGRGELCGRTGRAGSV